MLDYPNFNPTTVFNTNMIPATGLMDSIQTIMTEEEEKEIISSRATESRYFNELPGMMSSKWQFKI